MVKKIEFGINFCMSDFNVNFMLQLLYKNEKDSILLWLL